MAILRNNIRIPYLNTFLLLVTLLALLIPLNKTQASTISDFNPISHFKCEETSGVRYDSNTTNSNDLTDNNTVLSGTGIAGNGCDLESSSSEYLSITDASQAGLDPTTDISFSFWIKVETAIAFDTAYKLIEKKDSGHNGGYTVYYRQYPSNNDNIVVFFYDSSNNSSYAITSDLNLSTGTWYHVAVAIDVSVPLIETYVNAVDKTSSMSASSATTIGDNASSFRIGSTYGTSEYYDGLIDEITVSDTYYTSGNVTTLYNGGVPLDYSTPTATTSTSTTATTTVDMSDTNFMLGVIIFFLTFLFLGLAFSPLNRK